MKAPLLSLTGAVFARRLDPNAAAPIAVAYSGGGDSLAALIAAKAWADRARRPVVALHVDHQLQPASRAWASTAQATARDLGAACEILPWTGEKPVRGLAAAARQARHTLIAQAARTLGARVIVFGHTADDALEAELMRNEGSSLGRLGEWRPSPVWPAGRGLFLLRPLLSLRRAALRASLAGLGYRWIEDPANQDPRSPRARARERLAAADDAVRAPAPAEDADLARLAQTAHTPACGAIRLDRAQLRAAPATSARRFLSAALLCAAGGDRPPRRERLQSLLDRLRAEGPVIATLSGARLSADQEILIVREAGDYRRRGTPQISLEPGKAAIWDGRFLLETGSPALFTVGPLAGHMPKLEPLQRTRLSGLPREVRPSLPLVWSKTGAPTCPILAGDGVVTARSLIADRLLGFCGVISKESEI